MNGQPTEKEQRKYPQSMDAPYITRDGTPELPLVDHPRSASELMAIKQSVDVLKTRQRMSVIFERDTHGHGVMELSIACPPGQYQNIKGRVQKISALAGADVLFLSQNKEMVHVILHGVSEDILTHFERAGFAPDGR